MQIQSSGGGVALSCTLPAVALKAAIKVFLSCFVFFGLSRSPVLSQMSLQLRVRIYYRTLICWKTIILV